MINPPAHGIRRRTLPVRALLSGCLLLIAGCQGGDEETGSTRGADGGGGPGASGGPVSSVASSPADGTNVAACSDGNCEVAVTAPVDIRLTGQGGLTELSVTEVTQNGVRYAVTSEGGSGSGAVDIGCLSTFYSGGGGSVCWSGQPPTPTKDRGVLELQVVTVAEDTATIRLISGEPGEPDPARYPQAPEIEPPDFG